MPEISMAGYRTMRSVLLIVAKLRFCAWWGTRLLRNTLQS